MRVRAIAAALALATFVTAGPTAAQQWSSYASPEEGFAVEAPGAPRLDQDGFEPATMAALRNHTWPNPAGGALMIGVAFRNAAGMAMPAEAALREVTAKLKGPCEELRGQRELTVPGGLGTEFVLDKCPQGAALKARLYALDDRLIFAAVAGASGLDQAPDTQRFLDSLKLTPVVAAAWTAYTAAQDGFSAELPGTPKVDEGAFNRETYTALRMHEAITRTVEYRVLAAAYRPDVVQKISREQLAALATSPWKKDCPFREQPLSVPGGVGIEFGSDCPDGTVLRGRTYVVGDRLYQPIAAWRKGMADAADSNRFFDSFRLLVAAAPAPATAAPSPAPEWKTFTATEDGFSIDFPGQPTPLNVGALPQTVVSMRQYMLHLAPVSFIAGATAFDAAARRTVSDEALLGNAIDGMKANTRCEARDERRMGIPGGLVVDLMLDRCPDAKLLKVRLYAVGDRIYQIIVSGLTEADAAKPELQKFFDSFRLIQPAAVAAAAPPQWRTFTATDDGFAVDFPGTPTVTPLERDAKSGIANRNYFLDQGAAKWLVIAMLVPDRGGMGDEFWLGALAEGVKAECKTIRDERRTTFPGGMVSEFSTGTCDSGGTRKVRLYAHGSRFYQLIAAGPAGFEGRPETQRFFDSFNLRAPAPVVAAAPPGPAPATTRGGAPPAAAAVPSLSGLTAWNALVGNTITGRNDEGMLIEYYLADGTVRSKTDDELSVGRWTLRGDRVCFKFPKDDEECYRLKVEGDVAVYVESDGKEWRYRILKGNPRRL